MSSTQPTLSQDTVFDLLSSARRRYIIFHLRENEGEASINDLAAQIAVWENDIPPDELTKQDEKRVYVSLYQTHVPKLEEQGVVDYDGDSGMVRLTDQAYQIDRYLTAEEGGGFPQQLYYLGLALTGGLLFGLAVLEVSVFAALSPALVGTVFIAVIAVSAAAQFLLSRFREGEVPREMRVARNDDAVDSRDRGNGDRDEAD